MTFAKRLQRPGYRKLACAFAGIVTGAFIVSLLIVFHALSESLTSRTNTTGVRYERN